MFYFFAVVLCVVPAAMCGPFPQQQAQNGSPQPVQQPVQQPAQQPVQQPVQQPGQQPVQQTSQQPFQQNIQQPSQQPGQQSRPQPGQQHAQQPIQQINQQQPGQHLGQNGLPQSGEQQSDYRQNEQKQAIQRFSHNLVANPRIRKNYLMCFLDHGPCSPEAQSLKHVLPDAIREECTHCTDLQKKVIEKMMCYLNNNQPQILRQVAAKFDPQGEYMKQYISALEKKQTEELQRQQQQPLVESTTPVTTTTTTKKP